MHYDLKCFLSYHFSFIYDLSHHFTLPHVCLMAHFLFHMYFSKTYIILYYLLFWRRNHLHLSSIVWFESLALESKPLILAKSSVSHWKLLQNIILTFETIVYCLLSLLLPCISFLTLYSTLILLLVLSSYLQLSLNLFEHLWTSSHCFVMLCMPSYHFVCLHPSFPTLLIGFNDI